MLVIETTIGRVAVVTGGVALVVVTCGFLVVVVVVLVVLVVILVGFLVVFIVVLMDLVVHEVVAGLVEVLVDLVDVDVDFVEVELDRMLLMLVLMFPAALGGGAAWAMAERTRVTAAKRTRLSFMTIRLGKGRVRYYGLVERSSVKGEE